MPKFFIEERIRFEIEADTAQDALSDWLTRGEEAKGYAFLEVSEREVFNERNQYCSVEEP